MLSARTSSDVRDVHNARRKGVARVLRSSDRRRGRAHHSRRQVLSVSKQALRHQRTRALNDGIASALRQIFEDGVGDQLVSPTRRYYYFKSDPIAGVRQLHRRCRQRREEHVIADYGD
jgi:hypothetical protein